MKNKLRWFTLSLVAAAAALTLARAAQPDTEQQLIGVLQSSATPAEKDAACARLKLVGTARCVPALAALLTDEQLSHSARYALEPMTFKEAGRALLDALSKTTGGTRLGIIDSLGVRRETSAVAPVARLLTDADPLTGCAAARALGNIGGSDALRALESVPGTASEPLHRAVVDAELRCANTLLAERGDARAQPIFARIYETEKSDAFRVAAYRGMILAAGKGGLDLALRGIEGEPGPARLAALQLVGTLEPPGATKALAALLPKLEPFVQISLLDGLAQRNDPAAAAPIAALARSAAPEVRLASINALSSLGDASTASFLAEVAATGPGAEQKAARQALEDLRRGNVAEAMLQQLDTVAPPVQAELARALAARGDTVALPKLTALARQGVGPARTAALKGLGLLADQPQLGSLVRLVLDAEEPAARLQAAETLNTACQNIRSRHGRVDPQPLLAGLKDGSADGRAALLPICGGIVAPETRAALRASVADPNPQVREAAIRSMCDTSDVELLDDLVHLARQTREENFRMLAIAGAVRLTTEERAELANSRRVAALGDLLAGPAERPEQKRLVLAGLGEIPDLAALKLVEPALADPMVQTEAALAAVKIASALPASEARAAKESLQKELAGSTNDVTRQKIGAVLKLLEADTDYLADWQVAGPYRQAGKDYAALFDTVFPPETASPKGVNWRPLKALAEPKQPAVVDLLKALGGTQCVAYARTWVQSEEDQAAELELGSDDGIKVWLNGKQVYALNTARALRPGSDKASVQLHKGWNQLLFKITQNNQGWGFSARFRRPDGSPIEGLRCESAPKLDSAVPGGR